jgi:hypothetical protein
MMKRLQEKMEEDVFWQMARTVGVPKTCFVLSSSGLDESSEYGPFRRDI